MGKTTVGQRVYLVRLACGDGVRKAMPMREFAELLSGHDEPFHASRLSDIENDKSVPTLDEVERIAMVDPLKRGRDWLGWGDQDEGEQGAKPINGTPKPRIPVVETTVQYLDPKKPTQPNRAKKKPVVRRPGKQASA